MSRLLLLFISMIIIFICNTVVFPLNAGSSESGIIASREIAKQLNTHSLKDYPLVAAIVEPREEYLVECIKHFMDTLPQYTHFQVYHGTENKEIVYANFGSYIASGKMSAWDLNVKNLTIQGYSALLTSESFWRSIQSDRVLIFQTDAALCSETKLNIEMFYAYDFIGAPMPSYINILIWLRFLFTGCLITHLRYFNGGLSFRRRNKMLELITKHPWNYMWPEDVWFCAHLPQINGVLPTIAAARTFSFEAEQLAGVPLGVHKPRKEWSALSQICPQVKNIKRVASHSDYRNLFLL